MNNVQFARLFLRFFFGSQQCFQQFVIDLKKTPFDQIFFQEFQWISMSGFALSRLKYAFKNCHSIESIVWKLQNETIDLLTNTPQCRPEWCTCLLLVLVVSFYDVGGQCKVVIYIRIDACRFQHIQDQLNWTIQNPWYIHRHSVPPLIHATILNEPSFDRN